MYYACMNTKTGELKFFICELDCVEFCNSYNNGETWRQVQLSQSK